jgi:PAS domain S-box-containing protein
MEPQHTAGSDIELSQLLSAYQQAIEFNIICSITDSEGNIIYVNNRFCEVSKFSREELLGQNHRIVNSGYHSKDFFKNVWDTITQGKIWRGEVKSKAKDGSFFWLDSTIIPIRDADGNIQQYFSLRVPIDDKKELEHQNEMRIKTLEEMLFQISHRIRQPVTQILGIAGLLESPGLSRKELYEIMGLMEVSAQLLDHFTKELTEFMNKERKKSFSDKE